MGVFVSWLSYYDGSAVKTYATSCGLVAVVSIVLELAQFAFV